MYVLGSTDPPSQSARREEERNCTAALGVVGALAIAEKVAAGDGLDNKTQHTTRNTKGKLLAEAREKRVGTPPPFPIAHLESAIARGT